MQLQKESLIIFRLSRMQTLTSVILRILFFGGFLLATAYLTLIFSAFLLQFKYKKLKYSSLKKL